MLYNQLILLFTIISIYYYHSTTASQFPSDSDNIQLPPISILSIYMGKISSPHVELLMESMKWNAPNVDFKIINVLNSNDADSNGYDHINQLARKHEVWNFHFTSITQDNLSKLIKEKLGISVSITDQWKEKLNDFKPALAFLFPSLVVESKYKYWGYSDLDLIWGNFSRFSFLFQGDQIVNTDWNGPSGSANFYLNTVTFTSLFKTDEKFVQLLQDIKYHNLDENGLNCDATNIVDNGDHSIAMIQARYATSNNIVVKHGSDISTRLYMQQDDNSAAAGTGAVNWFRGSLKTVQRLEAFGNQRRELLFYRKPSTLLDYPENMRSLIFEDMVLYGYFLPYYIPVLSRFQCRKAGAEGIHSTLVGMRKYHPYHTECINKWNNVQHFVE